MANKRINIGALEFDQIKENLKEFLRGQSQFSDYDFEGANMSVLLDVLAYNTHYNAMYTNMAVNEAFLDSASKRDSVVSLARGIGYTPRSIRSARARISFTVNPGAARDTFITLPKQSPFNGTVDGVTYTFYNTVDVTTRINANDQKYYFSDVEVVEGVPLRNKIAYSGGNRYTIPNANIDTTTLVVTVQSSSGSTEYTTFKNVSFDAAVAGDSPVYFLREVDGGSSQLSFGDDVMGRALQPGNVVHAEYFVSSGALANNIRSLTYGGSKINGGTVSSVVLTTATNNGRARESIDEIRFNAPNMYAAQNRAVTAQDYEAVILSKVPSISAVTVWGGENNTPPVYGKVFISGTTKSGVLLSYDAQQTILREVVNNFKVVGIVPEFRDPEYLRIELDVVIYYDATRTRASAADIDTAATQLIIDYDQRELGKFNRIFRPAVVSRVIDGAEPAIVSSVIRGRMHKEVAAIFGSAQSYSVHMGNPIDPGSILSTSFITSSGRTAMIYDDGLGVVKHYTLSSGTREELGSLGTVNYSTGVIDIAGLVIVGISTPRFEINARSQSPDIASSFNQVVTLYTSKLKVQVIADDSTRGRALSGNKFIFTQSKI